MQYQNYLEDVPGKEAYRLSYSPLPGFGNALISPWVIVTGASGTVYQFMRGYGVGDPTVVLNFGAFRGTGVLDEQAPLVYSFSDLPVMEKFAVSETDDAVIYSSKHHTLSLGAKGFEWTDADGGIELHASLLGQPCTFVIPQQDGMDYPMLSRSHLGWVTGKINGDAVEGLWMHDHMYSEPGLTFLNSRFLHRVHNYWMNWLVEYDDGTFEGGHAWRGKPGTEFAAAHHYVDGHSVARTDARITAELTDRGSIHTLRLELGDDVSVDFEQHGSLDWPIHTYGTVRSISRTKKVKRSWNYTEHFPLNWQLVEDYQHTAAQLYGRFPSFQKIVANGVIRDGKLVFNRQGSLG
jgi:hypothetical protein